MINKARWTQSEAQVGMEVILVSANYSSWQKKLICSLTINYMKCVRHTDLSQYTCTLKYFACIGTKFISMPNMLRVAIIANSQIVHGIILLIMIWYN